jgi:hypothetical protein
MEYFVNILIPFMLNFNLLLVPAYHAPCHNLFSQQIKQNKVEIRIFHYIFTNDYILSYLHVCFRRVLYVNLYYIFVHSIAKHFIKKNVYAKTRDIFFL